MVFISDLHVDEFLKITYVSCKIIKEKMNKFRKGKARGYENKNETPFSLRGGTNTKLIV